MNPGKEIEKDDGQIKLIFENSGKDPIFAEAKLYFQGRSFKMDKMHVTSAPGLLQHLHSRLI